MSKKKQKKPTKKKELKEIDGLEVIGIAEDIAGEIAEEITESYISGEFLHTQTAHEASKKRNGRPPTFESPEDMLSCANEYFEWVASAPIYEHKLFNNHGKLVRGSIPKMRAMTIDGLCVFLGISRETWKNYEYQNTTDKEGFKTVMDYIKETMRDQKFTGAAADQLSPNIIARDLGLVDKTELKAEVKSHEQFLAELTD